MKKLFIIVCLAMLVLGCTNVLNSNFNSMEQQSQHDNFQVSEKEAIYLNRIFESTRKNFDFTNKKVGFIEISGERGKAHYFKMHEKHSNDANYPCDNGTLYIFNADQKKESGGYDAAIVYWSKFAIPVEKVIKHLKDS